MGNRIVPSSKKQSLSGSAAEQMALDFLRSQGLTVVARNFRTRRGEIDLIMLDNEVLVFVEVRFRQSAEFGSAEESITAQKCRRLTAAAEGYMQSCNLTEKVIARFDAIAISPDRQANRNITGDAKREGNRSYSTGEYRITWIQNILQ